MFGSEKAKNGYTLMVQMYFALQINQKPVLCKGM